MRIFSIKHVVDCTSPRCQLTDKVAESTAGGLLLLTTAEHTAKDIADSTARLLLLLSLLLRLHL